MTTEEEREKEFFDGLVIPTNPEYDFDREPHEQAEYANPVTLSNKLVMYANAMIRVTQGVTRLARKRERLRLERREIERELADLRRAALAKNPPAPAQAKTLALVDAWVFRCLEAEHLHEGWKIKEGKAAKLEDEIGGLEAEEENLKYTMHTLKLASENLTNRLSYTKHEANMSRFSA